MGFLDSTKHQTFCSSSSETYTGTQFQGNCECTGVCKVFINYLS